MSYELQGILKNIGPEQKMTDKFSKREFTIQDAGTYPQLITFQLINDKTDLIDPYKLGQEIVVLFNIQGKEWTSKTGEIKYFNSLNAYQIKLVNDVVVNEQVEGFDDLSAKGGDAPVQTYDDDLPF